MTLTWNGPAVMRAIAAGVAEGLEEGAQLVLAESNRHVPTERGDLEESGRVTADGLAAAASYDTAYAVRQHEDLTDQHDSGRTAKYLERAGRAKASEVAETVAARARRRLT